MKISKNWKSPLKNLLGCRETNGRVSRTGDVTGYNKRFAVHSVAKETVPFSAWKQSRGLLSWSISVVGAQAKGRTSNSSSRCATASSYARNVAFFFHFTNRGNGTRERGKGKGRRSWAASTRLLSSVSTWISFRLGAKCLVCEWIRFMNHFENYLLEYRMEGCGWMEVLVDCITIIG